MAEPLTEQVFRVQADSALEALQRQLLDWSDRDGFEVDLQQGVLNIEFEDPTPARFVISPNTPVRQIWVSALVKSFKLDWSVEHEAFVLGTETLTELVDRLIRLHLGQ